MTAEASTSGRVVVVTGGSKGIGLACAARLRAQGDSVVALSRSRPHDGVDWIGCDVRCTTSVDDAIGEVEARLGPVEVLVANAGVTADELLIRMTDEQFDDVLQTNLIGTFRLARRVARGMIRARHGRLVFVSSIAAMVGPPGQANYAASKAGLIGMARSIARELAPRGVTANVVAPGAVETDLTAGLAASRRELLCAYTPMGHFGSVDDVAAAVAFLASEEARFITGAVLAVDGGASMGL